MIHLGYTVSSVEYAGVFRPCVTRVRVSTKSAEKVKKGIVLNNYGHYIDKIGGVKYEHVDDFDIAFTERSMPLVKNEHFSFDEDLGIPFFKCLDEIEKLVAEARGSIIPNTYLSLIDMLQKDLKLRKLKSSPFHKNMY